MIDAALEGLRLVFSWPYILYPLAAVRLVVLVSKAGGPVEIVDGLTAKDIVVSPAETF